MCTLDRRELILHEVLSDAFLFLLNLLCIIVDLNDSENNAIMAGKIMAIIIIGLCGFI